MGEVSVKKMICPFDCPSSCGLLAEIRDGRIVRVKNDPDHPVSINGICRKMQQYEKNIYLEERILTPLRRTGKKGEGKFEAVSWEEALTEITDRWKVLIAQYGSETILPCMYSGVMSDIQRNCGDAFFNRMGASVLVKTLCSSAKGAGYESVMGKTGCLDPRELKDSDYYIVWGSNLAATRLQTLADLMKPENRYKKKVLIDTYANPTAKYCDQVILINPGTDGALALAMMHVLDEEGMVDELFLEQYAEGYDVLKKELPDYTPEWAESETGISAAVIRQLAREYGAAKAPAIILGSGNSRHGNGAMTVRVITILSVLTGAWQRPGGGLCGCTPINTAYVDGTLITRPDFRKKAARRININQLAGALHLTGEEAVRSLYVYAANPVNTVSNQKKLVEGLEREDLFTVVHERFMTDTARYADIILPAAFSAEQSDIYRAYGYCTLGTAWKVVEAPGECKSNWNTFRLLAQYMGYEEPYFQRTEEEMVLYMLDHPTEAVGNCPEEDRQLLRQGGAIAMPLSDHLDIRTKTGRIRIVNEDLKEPVPAYRRNYGGAYPLKLVAAPGVYSLNSTFNERKDLVDSRGAMTLWIHEDDAAVRGIVNGQDIIAYNDLAEVVLKARVTDRIARGAVVSEGVYTKNQSGNGYTINALNHERLSDMGEATTLNDNTVEVRPA